MREEKEEEEVQEKMFLKGVKHLCETGILKVPTKYIFPVCERSNTIEEGETKTVGRSVKLPVIDLAQLQTSNRPKTIKFLAEACEKYGFFQVVNHGIHREELYKTLEISNEFFDLPFEERSKYMSGDIRSPVRYGTSLNQNKDRVFCWRDFLKLSCDPSYQNLDYWPTSPVEFRQVTSSYAKKAKSLFLVLTRAILESLGLLNTLKGKKMKEEDEEMMERFEEGSQMLVINCYPPCPQPDLTLGMPPHSDYGFLTLLLQDGIKGLQILNNGVWVTVDPLADAFVVNVGDHLEIFSNGRYKSVLHRVTVNSFTPRLSVASLHSLPFHCVVSPSPKLVERDNKKLYKDTDFTSFLDYISSCEPKKKNFLDSRKLTEDSNV